MSMIRKAEKKDLALIVSQEMAATAGVYTKNLVKGAPLIVTQKHLANGYAKAIIANSGVLLSPSERNTEEIILKAKTNTNPTKYTRT